MPLLVVNCVLVLSVNCKYMHWCGIDVLLYSL